MVRGLRGGRVDFLGILSILGLMKIQQLADDGVIMYLLLLAAVILSAMDCQMGPCEGSVVSG